MSIIRSPEYLAKQRAAQLGKHHKRGWKLSVETKLKMSLAQKGKFVSESTRRKISNSKKGQLAGIPKSPEARLKNSLAHQGPRAYQWKGGVKIESTSISRIY